MEGASFQMLSGCILSVIGYSSGKAFPLMTRGLAFAQFLIVSLGAFILHLLVKVGGHDKDLAGVDAAAEFIARHALWFFAVPVLYAACANLFRGSVHSRPLRIIGFVLCAILLAAFGIPIFHYLR